MPRSESERFRILARQAINADETKQALNHYEKAYLEENSCDILIQKCLIELELAINDQNDDEQLQIALNTADRALTTNPCLPIAHLLRAKIQIHLGELSSGVKSVRSALDYNPENHHLAAYLKYLEEKTEGKEPENIIGTDKNQITKKLNSDLRTCKYTSDPLFNETLESVLNGDLDMLELERDERIRQTINLVNPDNCTQPTNDPSVDIILSDEEDADIERPPEKIESELTEDQREAELMKKKGNEQFVEKNLNMALDFYQKAVDLDPINPVFYSNSAAVYLDLKKYTKAREMCLKAIDLSMEYGVEDKIFGKILARLGNLDQQEGNYSSAVNWYKKSLKFNPNDKKPDKNLNFCQNKLKNEKRKALWDIQNAEDMIQKASILMSDSKYKIALEILQNSSKYIPDNEKKIFSKISIAKANCHLNIRSYVTAIAEAEKALTFNKECSEPFTIQGIAHEGLKNFDRASTSYTNAIRTDPDDMVARNGLERCLKASFTIRNGPGSSRTRIIDNEIEEIMKDDRIKEIIRKTEADPTSGISDDYYTDPDITSKLQKLIDNGLIKFQSRHSSIYPPHCVDA